MHAIEPFSSDASSLAPPVDWGGTGGCAHVVQFYEQDAFLEDVVDRFIGPDLRSGATAIVIATKPHRLALEERWRARGLNLTALCEQGQYVPLDAAETLSRIMVDGWPDATRFSAVVGDTMVRAAAAATHDSPVRAFGEIVTLLYTDGKPEAAVRLEELWNDLGKTLRFALMCGYPMHAFRNEVRDDRFRKICSEHSHVIPAESYTTLMRPDDRLRAITQLQQKASVLQNETVGREAAEKSLLAHQQEVADFFENAAIGLHWVGPDGVILRANPAELKMLGYAPEEYIGHHIAKFHVDRVVIEDMLRRLACGEVLHDYEARLWCQDGTIKDVLIDSNMLWRDGKFVHTRCFTRDITDRKRAEAEREELLRVAECARSEAEGANRAKDEFLAMLGHELRNPLSAVRNSVLIARLDGTRRAQALEIAHRQSERLSSIVDDLLDVARITQGKIVLQRRRICLAELVQGTIDGIGSLLEDRRQTLCVSLPEESVVLEADPARLRQVLMNLLTNAAKYSPPGTAITIHGEQQDREAVLSVRDNGIGIPPAMLSRVFELFTQAERSLDRMQGGLGIGLTVVKGLVELHGGHVEARSAGLGSGAEFVVRLPCLSAMGETGGAPSCEERVAGRFRTRVLIVEDNVDCAESLSMLLELYGHEPRVVHDGASVLDLPRGDTPDVMLVDIGLPGINGYEVARRIRQDPRLRHVVLVALTGYGREEDKRRAMAAGFDHHLAKPIDPAALQKLVAGLATADAPIQRASS